MNNVDYDKKKYVKDAYGNLYAKKQKLTLKQVLKACVKLGVIPK